MLVVVCMAYDVCLLSELKEEMTLLWGARMKINTVHVFGEAPHQLHITRTAEHDTDSTQCDGCF